MDLAILQKRKIDDLLNQVEELVEERDYWKQKAQDVYGEYLILCDKIVTQGIYFDRDKPKEENGNTN